MVIHVGSAAVPHVWGCHCFGSKPRAAISFRIRPTERTSSRSAECFGAKTEQQGRSVEPKLSQEHGRTGSQTAIAFWAYLSVTHSPRVGNGWGRLKNGARATRPQVDFDDDALLASEPRVLRESASKSSAYQVPPQLPPMPKARGGSGTGSQLSSCKDL
jgi:hypothetical protein